MRSILAATQCHINHVNVPIGISVLTLHHPSKEQAPFTFLLSLLFCHRDTERICVEVQRCTIGIAQEMECRMQSEDGARTMGEWRGEEGGTNMERGERREEREGSYGMGARRRIEERTRNTRGEKRRAIWESGRPRIRRVSLALSWSGYSFGQASECLPLRCTCGGCRLPAAGMHREGRGVWSWTCGRASQKGLQYRGYMEHHQKPRPTIIGEWSKSRNI